MERTKLIKARMKKHLTLEKASELLEVDDNTLYKWEKGKSTPRGYNIQKLCEVYGMTEEQLGLEESEVIPHEPTSSLSQHAFFCGDLTMKLLALAFTPHKDCRHIQQQCMQIIEEHDTMFNDPMTRRDALRRLAVMPAIFTLPLSASESLSQYTTSIAACWSLSKSKDETDLDLAFQGAGACAWRLKAFMKEASNDKQRQALAGLVGQCDLLRTILGWHLQGLKEAADYAHEALEYSEKAADIPLQISVHVQLAWLYYYTQQHKRTLDETDHATSLLKKSTIPLPSSTIALVYSNHALRQAIHNKEQDALTSLGLARQYFLEKPNDADPFLHVDYDHSSLLLDEGMAYARLEMHDRALKSFAEILDPNDFTAKIPMGERVRIEVLNNQTLSLLKSPKRDMELVIDHWKAAIAGATTLKSEQRFNEAQSIYELMATVWPGEDRIKKLRGLAAHW